MTIDLLKSIVYLIFGKEDIESNRIKEDIMNLIMTKYPTYFKQCIKEVKENSNKALETMESVYSPLIADNLNRINRWKNTACEYNLFNKENISSLMELNERLEREHSNNKKRPIKLIKECNELLKK